MSLAEAYPTHEPLAPGARIARLTRRYQDGPAVISIERARYFTESWRETEGRGTALPLRVAQAMHRVYERMRHCLDPDDRIAGHWSEQFLGLPIPIERGEYNQVLAAELTRKNMLLSRMRSTARGLGYMLRKGALPTFVRNQRRARARGATPLNLDLKTMTEREINRYAIDPEDRRELLDDLLPYWDGRALADHLERELLSSGLFSKDMHDFAVALTGNTSRQVTMVSTAATVATIQGHVILDFDRPLRLGLLAMREALEARLEGETDAAGREALESMAIALDGVVLFARRLADHVALELERAIEPTRREQLERMLRTCQRVPLHPATSFEEAVQSLWTVKTAVELAQPINLHCFGRLDQQLGPYYEADLAAGRMDRDGARELLEELLLKIMSQNIRPESNILSNFYHRYLGSAPVTLGGVKPDGGDGTNDVTYLFLEAAHTSKAVTNVSLRVHPGTPDALLLQLAEYLRAGTSSFALFNDETHVPAMQRRGFALEDARDYAIAGCVEAICPGKTGSLSVGAILLSRLLDATLRNGDVAMMAGLIHGEGLKTGDPDGFASFDELLDALTAQGRHFLDKLVAAANIRDRVHAQHLPAPYISAFIEGCLDSARDVTRGGARYDLSGVSMINSLANLVDSLYVIKRLVFEQRRFTIAELLDAVDHDFVGHEQVLEAIRKLPGKWGNGDPESDALARDVAQRLFEPTYRYRAFKGGPYTVFAISMITHTIDGRLSIAGPDGRRAATPFAASCNPYNVERNGVTGALRSVAALPFEHVLGAAVNIKFHPTAVGETETARRKWIALVRTYFRLGGAQLQPTCVSAETLRAAQQDPEQYRNLIVKVGGYSTYFVDLGREIQDEVIGRTEHR